MLPPDLCGLLEGRSRFARLGLMIHVTSAFVQPGVSNRQVLEMSNVSGHPLAIHPGVRICQIVLLRDGGRARSTAAASPSRKPLALRAVVQRVRSARVRVDGETVVAEMAAGLLALVGVARGDGPEQARELAQKLVQLRVFADARGRMNRVARSRSAARSAWSRSSRCSATRARAGARPGARPRRPSAAEPLVEARRRGGAARRRARRHRTLPGAHGGRARERRPGHARSSTRRSASELGP